jgi:hypothetical protein
MNGAIGVRPATEAEIDHLARLWHEGWNDAHGKLAPAGLVQARTIATFRDRLAAALIADGEARLAARGFATMWLACAIGNVRAARVLRETRVDDGAGGCESV